MAKGFIAALQDKSQLAWRNAKTITQSIKPRIREKPNRNGRPAV